MGISKLTCCAVKAGGVRWSAGVGWHDASEVTIDEIVRFEGDSDSAHEAMLLGLSGCNSLLEDLSRFVRDLEVFAGRDHEGVYGGFVGCDVSVAAVGLVLVRVDFYS